MVNIVCTLEHVTVYSVHNGWKYEGRVDANGYEGDDWAETGEHDRRDYHCLNCGERFDGRETFQAVFKHLGTLPPEPIKMTAPTVRQQRWWETDAGPAEKEQSEPKPPVPA